MEVAEQKHSDATFEHKDTKLKFLWDPYLNVSSDSSWLGLDLNSYSPWNGTTTAAVIFSSGLWYAKHLENQYLEKYRYQVRSLTDTLFHEPRITTTNAILPPAYRSQPNRTPIFLPIIRPDVKIPDDSRSRTLTAERVDPMNDFLADEAANGRIELFQSFGTMVRDHPCPFESDGLHASDHLTSIQTSMLLNFLCNSQTVLQKTPYDKTCCNIAPGEHLSIYMVAAAFVILLLLVANFKLRRFSTAYQTCKNDDSTKNFAVVFLAVIYCFAADRSPLFEKVNKRVDLPAFVLLLAIGLIAGLAPASRPPVKVSLSEENAIMPSYQRSFLSRQQSEEWKGWMQLAILLYHYFGMSKVLWVYQVARLLVASYLFMTGFGHTTYFLKSKDFSMHRVAAVLLRLNMLSCTLGYVMLSSYDFYYFSVLCSFWFVVVFCTLGTGFRGDISAGGIIGRCLGSIALVNSFIRIPGILEGLSTALHLFFRINFHTQEFRFRASLDVHIVYIGILVGWFYQKRHDVTFYSWLDSNFRQNGKLRWAIDSKFLLYYVLKAIPVTVLSGYLLLIGCFSDKYQYNTLHPWISPIFVLAYLTLRNSSKRLRETYSPLFAWLGRCSLETYVLQCHIWLAGDTKGLLCLGLLKGNGAGNLIEWVIITAFFLWTSWQVSKATNALTATILGPKRATTPRIIASWIMIFSVTLVAVNWLLDVLPRKLSLPWE